MDQPSADAGNFIGGNRGTNAAAAHRNAAFYSAIGNGLSQRYGEIRIIIVEIHLERAEILNLITCAQQQAHNFNFERKPAMVCRDSEAQHALAGCRTGIIVV